MKGKIFYFFSREINFHYYLLDFCKSSRSAQNSNAFCISYNVAVMNHMFALSSLLGAYHPAYVLTFNKCVTVLDSVHSRTTSSCAMSSVQLSVSVRVKPLCVHIVSQLTSTRRFASLTPASPR